MHHPFYRQNEGLYCKLFEDDEETFALTFYQNNKQINAILSDMSKECREDFFDYLQKKYHRIKEKFPEERNNHPISFDLNNLIENFSERTGYNIYISQEKRTITEEDFILPEERMTLDYIVLKELSNKHYITNKGILVKRETK